MVRAALIDQQHLALEIPMQRSILGVKICSGHQEIKLPNEQLLDFLLMDKSLTELMHHLVDTPNQELEGDEKFNLPSAACEVLCCEASASLHDMSNAIVLNQHCLQRQTPLPWRFVQATHAI